MVHAWNHVGVCHVEGLGFRVQGLGFRVWGYVVDRFANPELRILLDFATLCLAHSRRERV